ncbi:PDC sensor domain-containing protein [Salipaludibacillus sp. HK11]|uniref:PDC sensor domain-containing protein n=1 Tax=Salipaludibacillus sp. HK11 TaxID=3394320 RepID=UPI0039FCC459
MEKRIAIIFQKISLVNDLVQETTKDSQSQATMTTEATNQLEVVGDSVKDTLTYVEKTVEDMDAQHDQTEHLHTISADLQATSTELTRSINELGVLRQTKVQDLNLEPIKEKLLAITQLPEIISLDPTHHKTQLTNHLENSEEIEVIWSNRDDGSFIYSNPPAGLVNARQRDWWKQAMDGEFFISDTYISAITI